MRKRDIIRLYKLSLVAARYVEEMLDCSLPDAAGIPERTLARHKREGRLTSEESSRLLQLAGVLARGEQVFTNLDAVLDWLTSPNAALGATPLSLLATDNGTERVMDTLGRIEHGVFA